MLLEVFFKNTRYLSKLLFNNYKQWVVNMKNNIFITGVILISVLFLVGCTQNQSQTDVGSSGVSKSQAENLAINKMIQLVGKGSPSEFYVIDSYAEGPNYRVSLGSNKYDIDDCGPFKFVVYSDGGIKVDMPPECM